MRKERAVIVLDKRYRSQDGTFPIKIQITFQVREKKSGRRIRRYYSTGHSCLEKEFASLISKPRSDDGIKIKEEIDLMHGDALRILEKNPNCKIELFESRFQGIALNTVNGCFNKVIAELDAEERIGTSKTYQTALSSLKRFAALPATDPEVIDAIELHFGEITPDWLTRYERWMLKERKSLNTIGMYLRDLRAIFRKAIDEEVIEGLVYPFKKYKIRSEKKRKIPAATGELALLKAYVPPLAKTLQAIRAWEEEKPDLEKGRRKWERKLRKLRAAHSQVEFQAVALDYWKFTYYCNGMNMIDVAQLRHSDIQDGCISYDRSKIRRTKIQFEKIDIPIDHEIAAIISRRGAPTLDPNGYVFPILEGELSMVTIKNRVGKWLKKINKSMKEIASNLKINKKLTTVIARHTFGNRMANSGVADRVLSKALGHSNPKTTEHYKGSMDIDDIRESRKVL